MLLEPSKEIQLKIQNRINSDLSLSSPLVHVKVFTAFLIGCALSLTLCGQLGISYTAWAESLTHQMHDSLNPVVCIVIWGAVFAIFPIIFLKLFFCSGPHFKKKKKKNPWLLGFWFVFFGAVFSILGEHGQQLSLFFVWITAAFGISWTVTRMMENVPRISLFANSH